MNEKVRKHFDRRLPLAGFLGAALICLPAIIFGNDIETFLLSALIALLVALGLLIVFARTVRRHTVAALSMVAVFVTVCWLSFKSSYEVRTTGRWLLESRRYKAEVLALPDPPPGELKHAEWEGWGFPGAGDTVVYLVFDPTDSLAPASQRHAPGKYNGLPCEVFKVHRLEKSWYTVLFYTDTDWDHCA